ncbi:sensor histidine kinase [Faecalicatena orotica]|uniref:Two-component system sensor histidine kinase YesM n=1 Tax=Faecalicatena orotica TaxID=1544 RepID=A0A2Y9BDX1_9FIRM|nr:sensor histidine kinase [Faecalicatena orotica]PWJ31945.1 two-component system sensor histidine kinase YesM [Faecalicatena orotica]SSA53773.1 two-component system, sensor histidine kinase YesM [Faecalicatena orotica]
MKKKKQMFVSLNVKVFILGIVISMIPIAIIGTVLYRKSLEIVEQKQEAASENALDSIADSIQVTTDYVGNLSLYIIQNSDVKETLLAESMNGSELLRRQNEVAKSLMFYTGQNQFVNSIYIEGENGLVLHAGDVRDVKREEELAGRAKKLMGKSFWTGTSAKNDDSPVVYLTLTRSIRDTENLQNTLGTLWINVPLSKMKEQFSNYIETYPGYIALVDDDGNVLLSAGKSETVISDLEKLKESRITTISDKKSNTLVYGNKLPDTGWTIVSGLERSKLLEENRTIRDLLIYGIVASMLLCLLTSVLFSRAILHPLRLLTGKIREVKEDNYDVQLQFESNDEIGILSTQFNAMTRRMNELVNEVLTGKVLQTEAELKALQAQINPHFLYNNLDTAYWMSRLEHADKTGRVVLAIADLYRLTMNSGQKFISVETEIRYVENYIVIQELRTADQIQFHIEADGELFQWATMRFVIQPLVENSVEHGILPSGREGDIWIRGFKDEENLYFEVEDNGDSIDISEIEELLMDVKSEEKRGMAIRNIDQRIKLQFGKNYGLFFRAGRENGTVVRIVQPLLAYTKHM